MEKIELHKEHRRLDRLVGEWEYESEAVMEPDRPPSKFAGTESVRLHQPSFDRCVRRCDEKPKTAGAGRNRECPVRSAAAPFPGSGE